MRDILLECKRRGTTILMASHRVTEVERICDTVGIIKAGKIITEAAVRTTLASLSSQYRAVTLMPKPGYPFLRSS